MYKETTICICIIILIIWLDILTQNYTKTSTIEITECLSELKKEDQKRASYYNYYTGLSWGDPKDYDLVINVGRTGIEGAVKIIKDYITNSSK